MRTFLILTISLLTPYALYTAGCNQNRQAAFPKTPEMQALARAPEDVSPTRPPVIPAAIDREVLNAPYDMATQARVQAVMDRSDQYAYAPTASQPGLFVLPTDNQHYPMPRQTAPSAREFWSRPMAPLATAPANVPTDVYAMAPALGFEPLPEPITIGPAVPMAGPQLLQYHAVPVAPPPAPPAAFGPRPGERLLPPEDVPGVFMGTDAGDAIQPDAPKFAAATTAGFGNNAVPPLSSSVASDARAIGGLGLIGQGPPRELTAPKALGSIAPRAPSRLEALLKNANREQALAPLPELAAAPAEKMQSERQALSNAGKMSGSSEGRGFLPPPPTAEATAGAVKTRDLFRMDFWDAKTPAAAAAKPDTVETSPAPAMPPLMMSELPDMAATVEDKPTALAEALSPPEDFAKVFEQVVDIPEPKRVTLKPVRGKRELQAIDSEIEAPPLKF